MALMQAQKAPESLAPWIAGFSERFDTFGGPAIELPVGHCTLQVMLADDYLVERGPSQGPSHAPRLGFWGAHTQPRRAVGGARVHAFIVHLTARGAGALSGLSFGESLCRVLDLHEIAPSDFGANALYDCLSASRSFTQRVEIFHSLLAPYLAAAKTDRGCQLIDALSVKSPRSVGDIAAYAQMSPRALRRFFESQMGLSARHYLSLLRFERLLRNVHPDPWMERLPHRSDYADQAHACREFKRFAGMTQSQYCTAKRLAGDKLVHTLVASTSRN